MGSNINTPNTDILRNEPNWDEGIGQGGRLASMPDFNEESPTRNVKQWYMIVQEDSGLLTRGTRITGQFTPQQVTQNIGANIAEAGGFSRPSPIIQWAGGQLRNLSMNVRLFSEHREDSTAEVKLRQLEMLVDEYHRELNRPPLVAFFWGVAFPDGIPCMVESLGGVVYDEIRNDGTIRGVTLNVSLKRFTRYIVEQSSIPQLEQTPAHVVAHGETYEMIAYHRYGDPLLGVLLRQMNPRAPMTKQFPTGIADLKQGERVKLYPVQSLKREKIRPLCHVLKQDNYLAADNRRYFFELRSKEKAVLLKK
jgi:hypothetical protein